MDTKKAQDDLSYYFSKSSAIVGQYSNEFEHVYARPAIRYGLASFETRPLTSTFVAIFSALSFWPIISFIGFSIFLITSFIFVAISSALVAFVAVESILAFILFSFLTLELLLTLFLTSFAISAYLLIRFITLVRSDGRDGVREWATETKEHFFIVKKPKAEGSEVSDESDVGNGNEPESHMRDMSEDGVKVEGQ